MNDKEIFEKLIRMKEGGINVCLATIVEASGSTPRKVGAKMIVCADGTIYGSVGGGCGERQVKSAALRSLLITGQPEYVEISLQDDLGTREGDVCGGKISIFIDPLQGS